MRRGFRIVVLGLLAAAGFAGCGKSRITPVRDQPPTTTVFVQFAADSLDSLIQNHTTNHLVHLYWFGSDPDGDVIGYDYRFIQAEEKPDTVKWTRTTAQDAIFAVYTPTGASTPIFQVRAVDNAGLVDPRPATQRFSFTNQPPTLRILNRLRTTDSTFASLTLAFSAADPDGNSANMNFLVWLDGGQDHPILTHDNPFTIPTGAFKRNNQLVSGLRTVWVQPVDDGGMLGARDSETWFMRAPLGGNHGRLLLIDDVPAGQEDYGTPYTDVATQVFPGQYDLMRTKFTQPFRSAKDIEQTLELFDAVVWYRGPRIDTSPYLHDYQAGIDSALTGGVKLFLESQRLFIGPNSKGIDEGNLSTTFLTKYLGTDYLYKHINAGRPDSSVNWDIGKGGSLWVPPAGDSMGCRVSAEPQCFAVRDSADIAILAPVGVLAPPNDTTLAVGVSRQTPAHGRIIVVTVPLAAFNGFGTLTHVLTEFLREVGIP